MMTKPPALPQKRTDQPDCLNGSKCGSNPGDGSDNVFAPGLPSVSLFGRPVPLPFLKAVSIILLSGILAEILFGRVCPIQIVTGYPCPGCGMLHAALYLLTGRFELAMASHPALPLWIGIVVWAVIGWWRQKPQSRLFKGAVMLVCLLTIGLYLYRMATVFPAWPMNIYPDNLLARLSVLFS